MVAPEVLSVSVTACPACVWLYAPGTGKKAGVAAAAGGGGGGGGGAEDVPPPPQPTAKTTSNAAQQQLAAIRNQVLAKWVPYISIPFFFQFDRIDRQAGFPLRRKQIHNMKILNRIPIF
jgi:hypothetical protein